MKQEMMRVLVASAGPYANHLHLAPDNHASTSSLNFFMGWMLYMLPSQQCQSTEGTNTPVCIQKGLRFVVIETI